MKKRLHLLSKQTLVWCLFLISGVMWGQTWNYDFGITTGTFNSTAYSITFLPAPTSGTARVRCGTNPGSFVLANPGLSAIGIGSELQFTSNTGSSSTSKFSICDYVASKQGYVKFKIVMNGGTNGVYYFTLGDGVNFSDNNSIGNAQVFAGLKFSLGASNAVGYEVLNNTTYGTTGITTPLTLFSQSTSNLYEVEVFYNNETTSKNYTRSGISNSIAASKWDLWVNGTLVGDDLSKGALGTNANIDSFAFNHQSSATAPGTIYLDDIVYSNALPLNNAPTVSNVSISGLPNTTVELTGIYDYADTESDVDASTYKWYTATDEIGTDATAIVGATSTTFTLTTNELAKYIRFGVLAASSTGTSPGAESFSSWIGPVNAAGSPVLNAGILSDFAPTCLNVTTSANSFTLSGNNLSGNVTVGALDGFSFSNTENGTYTSSLVLTPVGNEINTTVFVKFTPSAVQSYNGNISVSGGGATAINVSVVASGINTSATVSATSSYDLQANSATVEGNIIEGCSAITEYGIEYSTTNNFTNGTGTKVTSSNSNAGNFTASISGLLSSTTYYFKAYATDGSGTVYGTQSSFVTDALLAPVATAGTSVSHTGFTANWNAVAGSTGYELDVYRGQEFELYNEDFNTFNGSGFSSSDEPGKINSNDWKISGLSDGNTNFGDDKISADYGNGISIGSVTNGGVYAFEVVNGNFLFGFQPTGSDFTPGSVILRVKNTTGQTLTSLSVSYKVYVNNNESRSSSFNFSHSANGTSFTNVPSLDYSTPTTSDVTGWIVSNKQTLLTNLSIANNEYYYLSWSSDDLSGSGSRDEFGLDDIVITSNSINYDVQNQNVGNVTSYNVTGLNSETEYFYRVRATDGAPSANSNEISVTTLVGTTTYTAGAWSNGTPTADLDAIIADNFTTTGDLSVKSLTINSGKVFTVATGTTLTIVNALTNNAGLTGFVVESDGVVLQNSTVTNTALATVKRNSTPLFRQDYTVWSSPVFEPNLRNFSPQTLFNRFSTYDFSTSENGGYKQEINNNEEVLSKKFVNAKGYLIRMPNNANEVASGNAQTFVGEFKGVLNNGTITIPLYGNVPGTSNGLNLVGNPYPSPININTFFAENTQLTSGTMYFWRKKGSASDTNNSISGYATYNALGMVSADGTIQGQTLTHIKPGQGFFVKTAQATPADLVFNNTMRESTSTLFFKSSNQTATELNRFWLNLSKEGTSVGQTLIGYTEGATQEVDSSFDALYFNDAPLALTSLVNNEEYIIQGRALPFSSNDVVPLSFKTNIAGSFTISLSNFDGLFASNQDIFLKDKTTNTLQNLKTAAYTFTTPVGVFNNRFEVQYNSALGTNNPNLATNTILIGVKNQQIKINAGTVMMEKIELIDLSGRVLYTLENVNSTLTTIENVVASNQMLIVRISTTENGVVNQKIIF